MQLAKISSKRNSWRVNIFLWREKERERERERKKKKKYYSLRNYAV